MKPRRNLIPIGLLGMMLLPVAMRAQEEDYLCTTNNGSIIIAGYIGWDEEVIIPATLYGLRVTCIGTEAFYHCANNDDLLGITVPNSVVTIGDDAFNDCYNVASVTLSTNLTQIGDRAFYACASLAGVTLPGSVTSLGAAAFFGCSNLTSVTIPGGIASVGFDAFSLCIGLTNVVISNGVGNLGEAAFFGCTGLAAISLPDSVTNLGDQVFEDCYGLTSVKVGLYPVSIGNWTFGYCTNLAGIYFAGYPPASVAASAFAYAPNVTFYYLPWPSPLGWGQSVSGHPTAPWRPQMQTADGGFGVRTNQFGFNIAWAEGWGVKVEACTDLASATWRSIHTNIITNGTSYFSDPQWTNYAGRFYRLRSP